MRNIFGIFRNNTFKPREKGFDGFRDQKNGTGATRGLPKAKHYASMEDFNKDLDVITNRLGETPDAVDALCFILDKIVANPKEQKFRQVNVTKNAYIKSIGKSGAWGVRFLLAIGFVQSPSQEYYNLLTKNFDQAKLWTGRERLQKLQLSEIYKLSKEKMSFSKEVEKLMDDGSETENWKKQEYLEKIPRQPKEGAAGSTKIRVYFGGEDMYRIFSSDDTLQSVLYWVAASLNTKILTKLGDGDYELIDRTTYPPKKIEVTQTDAEANVDDGETSELDLLGVLENRLTRRTEDRTLQNLELWPSGELEVQQAGFLSRERALNGVKGK